MKVANYSLKQLWREQSSLLPTLKSSKDSSCFGSNKPFVPTLNNTVWRLLLVSKKCSHHIHCAVLIHGDNVWNDECVCICLHAALCALLCRSGDKASSFLAELRGVSSHTFSLPPLLPSEESRLALDGFHATSLQHPAVQPLWVPVHCWSMLWSPTFNQWVHQVLWCSMLTLKQEILLISRRTDFFFLEETETAGHFYLRWLLLLNKANDLRKHFWLEDN